MKIVALLGALAVIGIGAGCGAATPGSGTGPSPTDVPPAPIEQMLPKGYAVEKVFDARLTGGPVPDKVVTSVGPPTGDHELKLRPATVQVIGWDADQKRWMLVFDAQKTPTPDTYGDPRTSNSGPGADPDLRGDREPLLDAQADISLGTVDAASLLSTKRDQLVISATLNYGGSGEPALLAVVDFDHAKPSVLYAWRGEHLEVELDADRILATSSYWIRGDSHCCPTRDYHFVVGRSGNRITELQDERPYLGVLVETLDPSFDGPYRVVEVAKGSPADGRLQVGDLLSDVENPPAKERTYDGARTTLDRQLSSYDAGDTARIVVDRDGARLTVPIELGSLKDALVLPVYEEDDTFEAL